MRMAHLLDGLRCADCLTLDVLWYDPVRGMVECAECGHRAHILPEIIEYADHPWFIGVQYHPELKSRPFEPHPLFASFVEAAVERSRPEVIDGDEEVA